MAKSRSPNYPAIGLAEAVTKTRKIWDAEHHARMSAEAAIKGMGYNTVNGASLVQLSAIKKYGLLGGEADDLRLSQDALTILHDAEGSPSRAAALHRAAARPTLFQELRKHFGEHVPSDNNLRSHLLQKGFIPGAADAASRAYRETMELVQKETGRYTTEESESAEEQKGEDSMPASLLNQSPATPAPPVQRVVAATPASAVIDGLPSVTFPLPRGNAVEIRLRSKLTSKEFKQLTQLFALLEPSLVEEPAEEEEGAGAREE